MGDLAKARFLIFHFFNIFGTFVKVDQKILERKKPQMASATVTSNGRITIPKAIRRLLGVSFGDRVEFVVGPDGEVMMVAATIDIADLHSSLPKPKRRVSLDGMKKAIASGARGDG